MPTAPVLSSRSIKPEVLDVLRSSAVDSKQLRLPSAPLDRKLYVAVNEVIESLGGKWNRKAKAHTFDGDPADALAIVLDAGKVPEKNPLAYFPTPPAVVGRMIELANIDPRRKQYILEPSAGDGAIAAGVRDYCEVAAITCVEIDAGRSARLSARGFIQQPHDFLKWEPGYHFDFVLMNPPFTSPDDPNVFVKHVCRAFDMLNPGGRLIAVCPSGIAFKATKPLKTLRDLIDKFGSIEELPAGSFKESDTGVNAVLAILDRPAS